ncbi:MAG: hypothetical protein IT518_02985 [Burkholderiales bacterium]|nr:hypothetical protein [Burkholderiales bacterium]
MAESIMYWMQSAWSNLCASPPVHTGLHGFEGPLLGNVLVAGGAGLITLACVAAALRMLIRPGERDRHHPKYRVLDPDR